MRLTSPPDDDLASRPFEVDGVPFRSAPLGGFDPTEHLVVVKPLSVVDAYRELLSSFENPAMVELGIAYGGSVGFLAIAARPSKLVAVELRQERAALLDRFIEDHGLAASVSLHYGVNQADRPALAEIVESEFGGAGVDVVIDDASHLYRESVASFEVLFPHVRPGGVYVIEDWNCDHNIRRLLEASLAKPGTAEHGWATAVMADAVPSGNEGELPQTAVAAASLREHGEQPGEHEALIPLSKLAVELALGPTDPASGIGAVHINPFWVEVWRNDQPLDPATFHLATASPDPFQFFDR